MRRIVLSHPRAVGDIAVMTALVRDLMLTRPGQFAIDVDTPAGRDIWQHNPYITKLPRTGPPAKGTECIKLDYGNGLRDQNRETVHFLSYFHRDFQQKTQIQVPLTLPYPDLHLSPEEQAQPLVEGRYWVIVAGGKSDFTIKIWGQDFWAKTIEILRGCGFQFVQCGSTHADSKVSNWHPQLGGVLNLVGQTKVRDFIRLIAHAEGVICGVTAAMHLAAGLHKPCVVIAGGREAWWWEAYVPENRGLGGEAVARQLRVPHRFLHTIGLLDCCQAHGCWKNKVIPTGDEKLLCYKPVLKPGQAVARCMELITPDMVANAALSYYLDGTLAPLPSMTFEHVSAPLEARCA